MSIQQVVSVVEVVQKAQQRIPPDSPAGLSYFSEYDYWLYEARSDTKVCPHCASLDGDTFRGNHLRAKFEWLVVLDYFTIEPHTHPNCRCLLHRIIKEEEKEE